MSENDDLRQEILGLKEHVEDQDAELERLRGLPEAIAELKGVISNLQQLVLTRFDTVDKGVERASSLKTAVQFAAVIVVPVVIAIIGGYFALRAGAPR